MRSNSSESFGKKISEFLPSKADNIHSSPASLEETKYLFTSVGAAKGCFFSILYLKPSSNDPFEKATLANLALDIEILSPSLDRNNSIIFFEAPIKLTGFAALSVETQKYFLELNFIAKSTDFTVLNMFVFISLNKEKLSFSLLTCFKADKFKT